MSKVNRKDLGKGLRALLNQNVEESTEKNVSTETTLMIPIQQIESNPLQPRNHFDEEELSDLAQSVKTYGLIQPITVRRLAHQQYQIISGERRWRASKIAGLTDVPAYVREANDQTMLEMALVENIQRSDLNPLEVAISYQRLIDECGLTHSVLSNRVGKKRSTITNYVRLLKLVPEIQKAVKQDLISMGHAKALASLTAPDRQLLALKQTLERGLSVRNTETMVQKMQRPQSKPEAKSKTKSLPTAYRHIQERLTKRLESKVEISLAAKNSGKITIPFQSTDDLNRILEILE